MGLMSWMWGSSSSGAPASTDPWRKLYDPGSPPNPAATRGAKYYDTAQAGSSPSVWDQVLASQSFGRKSFSDIDTDRDGYIDQAELQRAVGSKVDAARLVAVADKEGKGKISRSDYQAVMRGHFGTA